MAYSHWFVSRQKRQLTTILPALIAFSDICVGKKWAGNEELQLAFEDELQRREITAHGNLRARRVGLGGGGTRTLFKQMKDLGLIFTEDDTKLCRLTLVAEAIIKGDVTFVDAMRMQLQRYQYPSAACWKGSGAVDHSFNVHPFQMLLRLLRYAPLNNYLTMDEIAYIVIHTANSDDDATFNGVSGWILANRQDGFLPFGIADKVCIIQGMSPQEQIQIKKNRAAYHDIANTFCNYLQLTQYIDRGYKRISVRAGKEAAVDAFIQRSPAFIANPESAEVYQRSYGRGTSASDRRNFSRENQKSVKELNEARIRKEYVLLALKTPIPSITPDVIQHVTANTGIDETFVENFLRRCYPNGNISDFFLSYRELAYMGRDGARDFELATCEIFRKIIRMRAEHVGPLGNTPDVFVESVDGQYCGIIDNKAYTKGYSISGNHARVMKDVYIPNVAVYGQANYPLAFFTYIAGSFGTNINSQIQEIHTSSGICGSAMPVDLFINIVQDYAESGYDHNILRTIFSVNREVRLEDLQT